MGCTSSKRALSDFRRGNSLPSRADIKRAASGCGGGLHIVSLSSSTLGAIRLESDLGNDPMQKSLSDVWVGDGGGCGDFSSRWSDMIDQKIPTTRTTSSEPDAIINVWELMEGLEDVSPVGRDGDGDCCNYGEDNLGPIPVDHSNEEPKRLKRSKRSLVKERIQAFQERIDEKKDAMAKKVISPEEITYKCPPGGEDKAVLYLTSLRGIRKTYEDCCEAQLILKGYNVRIDERDVSMHSGFKKELVDILGPGFGSGCTLPRIFAAGRYLGGIDAVRETHEKDKLGRLLEHCESIPVSKSGRFAGPCKICDDVRFIPCETCSGSRKVYVKEDLGGEEGGDELGQFRRCPDCNENGLVRCPVCCDGQYLKS